MTPFQARAVRALKTLLAARGLQASFESRDCRPDDLLGTVSGDTYLVATLIVGGRTLEIYVYPDEAGFFVDQRWHPFESEDYDSPAELIDDLTDTLSDQLEKVSARTERG